MLLFRNLQVLLAAVIVLLRDGGADGLVPGLLRADIQEHQLSQGRWAVSGHIHYAGFESEAAALDFVRGPGAGSDQLNLYHHLRTSYPTLLFPHSSEDFVGNHSMALGTFLEEIEGCHLATHHTWEMYAEFGTEAEALAFNDHVHSVYVPHVQANAPMCAQADIAVKKLQCTTRSVHAKIRTCANGVEGLRELVQSTVDFYGDFSNETLYQNLLSRYPSMRRPLSSADLTHRMYQLEGQFQGSACPAQFDKVSGMYRRPDDSHEVDCCCKSPVDWEIEAEFEDEREAKNFLAFIKTTVPRMITLKGKACTKTVSGVMDVSDHIYTADIALRLCSSAGTDSLVTSLQSLKTVDPFPLLSYLKYALPTMQSPLTRDELVDASSLVHRTDIEEEWCSDSDSSCCCRQPTEWLVRGQFLSKKHARDFIRHMSTAVPASIHTKLGICAAPISGGLHELGCPADLTHVAQLNAPEALVTADTLYSPDADGVEPLNGQGNQMPLDVRRPHLMAEGTLPSRR